MSLTTTAKVKAFAGITSTEFDDQLDAIIPLVSSLIEAQLDRTIESATYREWLDGSGERYQRVTEYPVTRIFQAAYAVNSAVSLYFSGGSMATVSVQDATLKLFSVSSAGVEADVDLDLATYPTITLLVAQINATGGWSATTETNRGSDYSLNIKPFDTQHALSPDTADLYTPDEAIDVRVADRGEYLLETIGGGGFPKGRSNVFVWYTGGYTTVPGGLEAFANQIALDTMYGAQRDGSLSSEKIGNYQYQVGTGGSGVAVKGMANALVQQRIAAISAWRRLTI